MNDVIIDSPSVMNEQKSGKLNEEMKNDICICLTNVFLVLIVILGLSVEVPAYYLGAYESNAKTICQSLC